MTGKRINIENDLWFLDKVNKGILIVDLNGTIYNSITNRFIGAVGSGKYFKISMKDMVSKKIRNMQVHRLVWLANKGPIPIGFEVDHIDDNKLNNNFDNLQLLSNLNNTRKAILTGAKQAQKGEKNPSSKLTDSFVLKIREYEALNKHRLTKEWAQEIGCSATAIELALCGKTFKHL